MSGKKQDHQAVSGVFTFLLLGLFAVFATLTVLLGAKAYRSVEARSEANSAERLAVNTVRSLLRTAESADDVTVTEEDGVTTVNLRRDYGGEVYLAKVYVWGGMLYEQLVAANAPFKPENGEAVCAAEELTATMDGSLLTVRIMSGGVSNEVAYALVGGGATVAGGAA